MAITKHGYELPDQQLVVGPCYLPEMSPIIKCYSSSIVYLLKRTLRTCQSSMRYLN